MRDLLPAPRRRLRSLRLIPVVALLCGGVAALYSSTATPVYSATARLVASAVAPDQPDAEAASADQVYARTFTEVLGSASLADRVAAELPYRTSARAAADAVSFTAVPGTTVVEVTAESSDPRRAAALATTWAEVSAGEGAEILGVRNATLALGAPAVVPTTPQGPRPSVVGAAAAAGGAVLAALALAGYRRPRGSETDEASPPAPLSRSVDADARNRLRVLLDSHPWWTAGSTAVPAAAVGIGFGLAPGMSVPGSPSARVALGLVTGAVIGALVGVVVLVARDRRRRLVLLPEDAAESTGADVVVQTVDPHRLVVEGVDMRFRDVEPYQMLHRTLAQRTGVRVVLVVTGSAVARAALCGIDVAVAGAAAGSRTVLVGTGADLHRRSAGEVLRRVVENPDDLEAELVPTDRPGLRVLPLSWGDAQDGQDRAPLESRQLAVLVDSLLDSADLVVVSSPPVTEPEVSLPLAGAADAAVLTVVAGRSTRADCRRAAELLRQAGCPVVGVVLLHRGRTRREHMVWTRSGPLRSRTEEHPPGRSEENAEPAADALSGAGGGSGRAGGAASWTPTAGPASATLTAPRGGVQQGPTTAEDT